MGNQHPITPPPDLVKELQDLGNLDAITLAYQAGADQELGACCEWLENQPQWMEDLHAARRPKPPSLKEQALEQLDEISNCFRISHGGPIVCDKIRQALEALPNE